MGAELKPSYYRQMLKNLATLSADQHEAQALLELPTASEAS